MAASFPTPSQKEKIATFVFGIGFLIGLVVLAIFFPKPTPFQYVVFRVILALAAAGFAAFIPGFIHAEIKHTIRAGGALAVFIVVYFFSPASILSTPPSQDGVNFLTIAGIVVDRATSQGLGQARINVVGQNQEYVTEDNGNFRIQLRLSVPGRVRLLVNKEGFHQLDATVQVPAENLILQLRQ